MTDSRLGFAFALLATTSVVACGSSDAGPARVAAPEAGAGGRSESGGAPSSGGATAPGSGGTAASGGSSGSPREGGACLPALARCDDGTPCCPGSVCAATGTGERRCRDTCSERTDCGSLCCLDDPESGKKLCADASLCPAIECSEQGGPCTQVGEACCAGLVCVAWTNPPRSGCEKACGGPSDCETGCCIPLPGTQSSFCAPAGACQCAALDAKCGGTARCCDGLECTTFDATGAFACKPTCEGNGDCATNCCVPLPGTNTSVCLGKEWCGK